jgi:hypothetical protein
MTPFRAVASGRIHRLRLSAADTVGAGELEPERLRANTNDVRIEVERDQMVALTHEYKRRPTTIRAQIRAARRARHRKSSGRKAWAATPTTGVPGMRAAIVIQGLDRLGRGERLRLRGGSGAGPTRGRVGGLRPVPLGTQQISALSTSCRATPPARCCAASFGKPPGCGCACTPKRPRRPRKSPPNPAKEKPRLRGYCRNPTESAKTSKGPVY